MIELVSSTNCIACDICVKVCPANVFDRRKGDIPVIARQEDCQTCFLCEVYCPVDALYVAPVTSPAVGEVAPDTVLMGSYARELGWRKGKPGGTDRDPTFRLHGKRPAAREKI